MKKGLGENYTPIYFLSALGNGGLAVSFFIYFMFMIDHPKVPLATFDFIYPVLTGDNTAVSVLTGINLLIIIFFAFQHYKMLIWNIKEYNAFKKTQKFQELKESSSAVSLMAIPLTYAMSINVAFVLGAVFVPKLWTVIEYLLPGAIVAFVLVGVYAMKIFLGYFGNFIIKGNFDYASNNNLSQMMGIFAFAMVSVGLAAPVAMTHYKVVSGISLFLCIFFLTAAFTLAAVKINLGLKAIFKYGISKESSVSLWIAIPIITVLGIAMVRLTMGLSHNFDTHQNPSLLYVLTSILLSLQLLFGFVGYVVMKRVGYFKEYISGEGKSVASYGIICPGVAIFVFGMFFVSYGLVKNGIVAQFGIPYFIIVGVLALIQYKTVAVLFGLNKKLLKN